MLLEKLIGAEITGINRTHDYWQILTDKGTINIYGHVSSETFHSAVNCTISGVQYNEDYLRFDLDNKQSVMISLDSPDGLPEYFSVYLNTGEIITE
ncbi:MAG: hypothetical protein NC177_06085 [Ruminococcus flavefaciens]|nr:hypothetical protein [Ruminococcus flavefaciens]